MEDDGLGDLTSDESLDKERRCMVVGSFSEASMAFVDESKEILALDLNFRTGDISFG